MRNDILIEFQRPDGTWFNASPYRLDRDPVSITRGKSPSDKTAGAAQANFTLKNPAGLFSLRNPSSPLYGVLKRNTPVRISKRVVRQSAAEPGLRKITFANCHISKYPCTANWFLLGLCIRVEECIGMKSANGITYSVKVV